LEGIPALTSRQLLCLDGVKTANVLLEHCDCHSYQG
jgi:hypothetical protein